MTVALTVNFVDEFMQKEFVIADENTNAVQKAEWMLFHV